MSRIAAATSNPPEDRSISRHNGAYRLGRDRRYLTWLASDTATGLSGSLAAFALPLIALVVTGSPVQAGVIGAVSMVFRLFATLIGGVLADRHARLGLMVLGGVAGVVLAGLFTALGLADAYTFLTLMVLSILLSLRGGLFATAGEAAIKEIVPDGAMGRAQAANQARDAALGLAGAPLGGVLLALGGWLVGAAMTASQLVAWATAVVLRHGAPPVSRPADTAEAAPRSMLADSREGIVWLFRRPDLRGVLLVSTVVNLGFNAGMTTVIYALQIDGYSPQAIGAFTAVMSAAMLLGAAFSTFLVSRVKAGSLALWGLISGTVGILALAWLDSIVAMAAILAVAVLGFPALNAGLLGYMTVATPSRLLGRVNSALAFMAMGAMPLAPLVAGVGLEWLGRSWTLVICGAICVVAVAVTVATPSLRALPKEADWSGHAQRVDANQHGGE